MKTLLTVCICQAIFVCQSPFKKPKKRKTCVKKWLRRRETLGAHKIIFSELQLEDCYHNNSFWFA